MKKNRYALLLAVLLLPLVSCAPKTARNEEELLRVIVARENIPETCDVEILGKLEVNGYLVVFTKADAREGHRNYYATEFTVKDNKYIFSHRYNVFPPRADDVYVLPWWQDGYVFVVDNPNAAYMEITYLDGQRQIISISEVPFVYYLPEEYGFEYYFFDHDGKKMQLSPENL